LRRELYAPLSRFAGLPEPMIDAIAIARDAKLLDPSAGGVSLERPEVDLATQVTVSFDPELDPSHAPRPLRLLVLAAGPGGELSGSIGDRILGAGVEAGAVHIREVGAPSEEGKQGTRARLDLDLHEPKGILAAWVVSRVEGSGSIDLRPPDK
jgi:hypothetical protein